MLLKKLLLRFLKNNNLYVENYHHIKSLSFTEKMFYQCINGEKYSICGVLYTFSCQLPFDNAFNLYEFLSNPYNIKAFNRILLYALKNDIKNFLINNNVYYFFPAKANFDTQFDFMCTANIHVLEFIHEMFVRPKKLDEIRVWQDINNRYIDFILDKLLRDEHLV